MLVSLAGTNRIAFYNVLSSTSYTLTSTITTPNTPYNMHRVNDSFIYLATMTANSPIYILTMNSSGSWIWNSLPATRSTSSSYNFHTIFDPCGRMWISVKGYGIRIFDSTGSRSLYNWTLTSGLNNIALSDTFDFYAADFNGAKIHSFRPNIDRCTSWLSLMCTVPINFSHQQQKKVFIRIEAARRKIRWHLMVIDWSER